MLPTSNCYGPLGSIWLTSAKLFTSMCLANDSSSRSDLDLPPTIATNHSPHDSRSANDGFHTPGRKPGMRCLPNFKTDEPHTVCADTSCRHFCLYTRSLHSESLAAGHFGVSDGQSAS